MRRRNTLVLSLSYLLFVNVCSAQLPGSSSTSEETVATFTPTITSTPTPTPTPTPTISPAGNTLAPSGTATDEIVIDGEVYNDMPEVEIDTDDREDGVGNQCVLTGKESLSPSTPDSPFVEMFFCSVTLGGCKNSKTKEKEKEVDCVGLNQEQCKAAARKQCEDALALDENIFCPHKGGKCTIYVKQGDDKETKEIEGVCGLLPTETKATGKLIGEITVNSGTGKIVKGKGKGTCYYICSYNCQKKEKAA